MMSGVSGPNESDGRVESPSEGASVLANLPRTRPQRATARRAAARRSGEAEVAAETAMTPAEHRTPARGPLVKGTPAKPAKPRAKLAKGAGRAPSRRLRAVEPVPRQGFESEGDRASGPVAPPGGIELLASAAELLGELAKAGVSSTERLLRDFVSRLPGA
jgi:hypothetical protein